MTESDDGPAGFFRALTRAFEATIHAHRRREDFIGALCAQAFDSFQGNIAIQSEGAPLPACQGECSACCSLRVVATAPEIFLLTRFVTANAETLIARGVDLKQRIIDADAQTARLSEKERMALRRDCPLIERALCLAYRLRPLACRGHASYDKKACELIAAGQDVDAAVSTPHIVVRSLVQGALMSALCGDGLSFRLYELNRGLTIALSRPDAEESWVAGGDPLEDAAISDFSAQEARKAFEAIGRGDGPLTPSGN